MIQYRVRFLPNNIHDALQQFRLGEMTEKVPGKQAKSRYLGVKTEIAARSPRELGTMLEESEVIFHHDITNQVLWDNF